MKLQVSRILEAFSSESRLEFRLLGSVISLDCRIGVGHRTGAGVGQQSNGLVGQLSRSRLGYVSIHGFTCKLLFSKARLGYESRHWFTSELFSLVTFKTWDFKSIDLKGVFDVFMRLLSSIDFLLAFRSRKAFMSFSMNVLGILIPEGKEIRVINSGGGI